jgi:hypothetical protein
MSGSTTIRTDGPASRTAIDLRPRSGTPRAAIPIGVVGDAVRRPEPTVLMATIDAFRTARGPPRIESRVLSGCYGRALWSRSS